MNTAPGILPGVEGCDTKEEEDAMDCEWDLSDWTLSPKDLTILAHFAITTSSTRRRLMSG